VHFSTIIIYIHSRRDFIQYYYERGLLTR